MVFYLFKKAVEFGLGHISFTALVHPALQRLENLHEGEITLPLILKAQWSKLFRFTFSVPCVYPVTIQLEHGVCEFFIPVITGQINVVFPRQPVQPETVV